MKCDNVQNLMVEYREGGLRVADEMSLDIHLIQCRACRQELQAIGGMEGIVCETINTGAVPDDSFGFVRRLENAGDTARMEPRTTLKNVVLACVRAGISTAIACLLIAVGLALAENAAAGALSIAPEAGQHPPLARKWAPWFLNEDSVFTSPGPAPVRTQNGSAEV